MLASAQSKKAVIRVFLKIDDSDIIGKKISPVGIEPGTPLVAHFVLHSHAFFTELTWQVLREGI